MAKKKAKGKKSSKKSAKKTAKKSAKRSGGKSSKKAGKKSGKKSGKTKKAGASMGPVPVNSGNGPSPAEVGAGVVAMVREGAGEKAIWDKWFSPRFVSIEGAMGQAWHGRKAVQGKADWWYSAHTVHGLQAEGPYIGATGFAVKYTIDAEEKETGKRWKGDEIAFYTVSNGKVTQEEFMGMPM